MRLGVVLVATAVVAGVLNLGLVLDSELIERDFGRTLRDDERKGASETIVSVAEHAGRSLLDERFHGPWIGAAACSAMLWLLARTIRRREGRWEGFLLIGMPLIYLLTYLLVTSNPSEHNGLPPVSFTSLGLALAGSELWVRRPMGKLRSWSTALGATLGLCLLVVGADQATRNAWRAALPTAGDLVEARLIPALEPVGEQFIIYELGLFDPEDWMRVKLGRVRSAALGVDDLFAGTQEPAGARSARLDLADAEVFSGSQLGGVDGDRHRERLTSGSSFPIGDPWWQARGPAARIALHPGTESAKWSCYPWCRPTVSKPSDPL